MWKVENNRKSSSLLTQCMLTHFQRNIRIYRDCRCRNPKRHHRRRRDQCWCRRCRHRCHQLDWLATLVCPRLYSHHCSIFEFCLTFEFSACSVMILLFTFFTSTFDDRFPELTRAKLKLLHFLTHIFSLNFSSSSFVDVHRVVQNQIAINSNFTTLKTLKRESFKLFFYFRRYCAIAFVTPIFLLSLACFPSCRCYSRFKKK